MESAVPSLKDKKDRKDEKDFVGNGALRSVLLPVPDCQPRFGHALAHSALF